MEYFKILGISGFEDVIIHESLNFDVDKNVNGGCFTINLSTKDVFNEENKLIGKFKTEGNKIVIYKK